MASNGDVSIVSFFSSCNFSSATVLHFHCDFGRFMAILHLGFQKIYSFPSNLISFILLWGLRKSHPLQEVKYQKLRSQPKIVRGGKGWGWGAGGRNCRDRREGKRREGKDKKDQSMLREEKETVERVKIKKREENKKSR